MISRRGFNVALGRLARDQRQTLRRLLVGRLRGHPVILMNWNGTEDHVFTLAHEAGHAMHSFYADHAQPFHDCRLPDLHCRDRLDRQRGPADLASAPGNRLPTTAPRGSRSSTASPTTFHGTLLRQTMFAEFEHLTHSRRRIRRPAHPRIPQRHLPRRPRRLPPRRPGDRRTGPDSAGAAFPTSTAGSTSSNTPPASRPPSPSPARSVTRASPAAERYLELLARRRLRLPTRRFSNAPASTSPTPDPVRSALEEFDRHRRRNGPSRRTPASSHSPAHRPPPRRWGRGEGGGPFPWTTSRNQKSAVSAPRSSTEMSRLAVQARRSQSRAGVPRFRRTRLRQRGRQSRN